MKKIIKLICLKLAIKLCTSEFGSKLYYADSVISIADMFYNWLTGKRPEE